MDIEEIIKLRDDLTTELYYQFNFSIILNEKISPADQEALKRVVEIAKSERLAAIERRQKFQAECDHAMLTPDKSHCTFCKKKMTA